MTEVAALVGISTSAAQFLDIGCRIVLHASSLYSRFQSVPQCLQRTLDQVQLLMHLADLVSRNDSLTTSSQSRPTNGLSSTSWLDNVWRKCTTQAQNLEKIIKSMLCETEDSYGKRVWKKILTLKREETIL